jgi:hypothetical protein
VTESGIFDPQAVGSLAAKAAGQASLSETEEMALTAVLSLQLVYRLFIRDFRKRLPEHPLAGKPLKLVDYTSPMETPDGSK